MAGRLFCHLSHVPRHGPEPDSWMLRLLWLWLNLWRVVVRLWLLQGTSLWLSRKQRSRSYYKRASTACAIKSDDTGSRTVHFIPDD